MNETGAVIMNKTMLAALGAALFCAQSAGAVEVTGGSIGLSYSAFTANSDVNRLGIEGAVEFAFNRNISMQADIGHQSFGATGVDSTTLGLHGIFHLDDQTSFGAFYVNENADLGDVDTFGLEAGYEVGQFEAEGYLSSADDGVDTFAIYGVSGRYEMPNTLGVTGAYDRADDDSAELSRLSIKLDRDVSPAVNLFVEVGTARTTSAGVSDTNTFVGIGGKYVFGAERGATFEQRGFLRLLPGL
jgi:hypothetical protein